MIVSSRKRSYTLNLNEKLFEKLVKHLSTLCDKKLQEYIDTNFKTASRLGSKNSGGAWAESRMYRDKAKLAIIIKEGMV